MTITHPVMEASVSDQGLPRPSIVSRPQSPIDGNLPTNSPAGSMMMGTKRSRPRYTKIYAFDWDDNLLFLPTTMRLYRNASQLLNQIALSREDRMILLGPEETRLIETYESDEMLMTKVKAIATAERSDTMGPNAKVSGASQPLPFSTLFLSPTANYAKLRPHHGRLFTYAGDSYAHFSNDSEFLKDIEIAIARRSFGPSYPKLKEAVLHAFPLLIITARGQSPFAVQTGLHRLIEATFTEEEMKQTLESITAAGMSSFEDYIASQKYYPVSSRQFKTAMNIRLDDRSYTTEYGKRLALTTYVREFTAKHGSSAVRFLNADDSSRVRKRMKSTDGSSWNITSYFEHSSTASTSSSSLNPSPTSSTISTLSPPTNVDSNSCSESTVSSVSSPTNVIPSSLQGTGLSPSSASSIRLEVKDTVSTFNNVGRSDEVGEDDDDGDEEDTSYLSVGFSDDDPKNVEAIKALFEHTLSPEHPHIRFCIYDTSDPAKPKKTVFLNTPRTPKHSSA